MSSNMPASVHLFRSPLMRKIPHLRIFFALFLVLSPTQVGFAQLLDATGGNQEQALPTALESVIQPLLELELAPLAATSCAASACHGNDRPGLSNRFAAAGSEYPLWLESDPHARSSRTLCTPKSLNMMSLLGIVRHGQVIDQPAYDNCTACHHSSSELRHLVARGRTASVQRFENEGVGCAGCHGPAEAWVGDHFRMACGARLAAAGHVDMGDLVRRARVCASCHIGDTHRDMNHDLIAAGHPPLRYEFSTFHNRLPKHWRDEEAFDCGSYETRLWLAGQIAGMDASLALLEARAEERTVISTWPEFSEYECASCHHDQSLLEKPVSRERDDQGLPKYSAWHQTGLRLWLERPSGRRSAEREQLLADLRDVQRSIELTRVPDATQVAAAARRTRVSLDRWLQLEGRKNMQQLTTAELNDVVRLAASSTWLSGSWESAAQYFLAVVAGREGWQDNGVTPGLAEVLRQTLRYPDLRELNTSPLGTPQAGRISHEQLQERLQNLGSSLGSPTP